MKMKNNKLKGQRLRKIRKHLGIKQHDFAQSLDITGGYLSEIETGKKKPGIEILNKLINRYYVNIAYLFTGKGSYFIQPEKEQPFESESKQPSIGDDIKILKEMQWYIDNIPVVRYAIIEFFKSYLYDKRGMIEQEVEKFKKENPEEKNK
jgi:transcriptional regulator with XRE-family HTH domain